MTIDDNNVVDFDLSIDPFMPLCTFILKFPCNYNGLRIILCIVAECNTHTIRSNFQFHFFLHNIQFYQQATTQKTQWVDEEETNDEVL